MAGARAYRDSSGVIRSGSRTLPPPPAPTSSKKVTTITVSDKEYDRLSNIKSSGGSVSSGTINQSQVISSTTKQVNNLPPPPLPSPVQQQPTGGLVNIGSGKSSSALSNYVDLSKSNNELNRPKTIEQNLRGTGLQPTRENAIMSLQEKGLDVKRLSGQARETEIQQEQQRLLSSAATPAQRERLEAYGFVLAAGATLPYGAASGTAGLIGTGVSSLAKFTAATAVSVPTGKGVVDVFNPSPLSETQRRQLAVKVQDVVSARTQKEGLDLPFVGKDVEQYTGGLVGNVVDSLFGGKLANQTKFSQEYVKAVKDLGYSGKEAERIAAAEFQREVYGGGTGEIAGFAFGAGAVGELSGAATQKGLNIVTDVGKKVLTKSQARAYGAVSGAIGGAIGGVAEVAISDPFYYKGRYKQLTPQQYTTDVAFGGLTAGLGGGIIGGLVANRTTQKIAYAGAAALELGQEYAGDITLSKTAGKVFESSLMIKGMGKVKVPTVTSTIVPSISQIITPTKSTTPTKSITPTQSLAPTGTSTYVPDVAFTPTPSTIYTPEVTYVPSPSSVYTPTGTSTWTPTQTITDTPVVTPTETPVETPTETQTNTFTATQTLTPTLTTTAFAPFPFAPPMFDFSNTGQGSGRGRTNKRYFNEFASAQGLLYGFDAFTGYNSRNVFKPTKARPTKQQPNVVVRGFEAFTGYKAPTLTRYNPSKAKSNVKPFNETKKFNGGFNIEKYIFNTKKSKKRRKR